MRKFPGNFLFEKNILGKTSDILQLVIRSKSKVRTRKKSKIEKITRCEPILIGGLVRLKSLH